MSNEKYPIDLTGYKFGKLTVIKKSPKKTMSGSVWTCKCECGNVIDIARCGLVSGHTKTCGCSRADFFRNNNPTLKHGATKRGRKRERLYRVWCGMRERCSNPHHNRYKYYGARGITVCREWDDYSVFRSWAMANGYDPEARRGDCTIDRIDVNGSYCPDNCRWVDNDTQAKNKRAKI